MVMENMPLHPLKMPNPIILFFDFDFKGID